MPSEITMPQLSDTMTEGTVIKWLKKEGDRVKEGEIIAEVETDKATMEWEATDTGTLAVIVAREGDKVKVGNPIAVLATGSEDPSQVKQQFSSRTESQTDSQPGPSATETEQGSPQPASSPKSVRTSHHSPDHGGNGADAATADRVRVSPIARRLAEERGIDLSKVTGSGPGGRIVQQDVLDFAPTEGAKPAPSRETPAKTQPERLLPQRVATGQKEVIPLNKMRVTIAQRLQQSKQQVPHFYETIDVDLESLVALRETLNKRLENQDVRLSISDFVNKAVAAALLENPTVNSHFNAQKNEYTRFGDVNLGIAVALPDGLIVPVLRNIDQMGLREIRQRSQDLADRARSGKLKHDELTGATFTVSTLGMYGVREFGAIINPPEVGILAVGAAEKRAVVRDNQIAPRTMMSLTLSVDHRVVDGATAAEFLRTLKAMLEEPGMMLA
jgi:pyruvate dehydrogenase E2 component (dihydrolipoamide acetyltransferase)